MTEAASEVQGSQRSSRATDDLRLAHILADDADSLSMNRFKAQED